MKKKRSIIFLFTAVCCFMVMAVASSDDDTPVREPAATAQRGDSGNNANAQQAATDERFVLNETASFRNISVTAEEIIVNDGWKTETFAFFTPSEGNKFVAVRFNIENTSSEEQIISTLLLFEAYADGIKLEFSFGAALGLPGTLDGTLSPGRRMVGYYGVEVSENARELELEVRSSWLGSGKAVFVFDIP
ncbi:MAG: DUF4352 domain-containing protein [Defluviitaleaceae bacterium]|nr:DUF4352 domain-containing protein [Defluviitaleaceae bacterium]